MYSSASVWETFLNSVQTPTVHTVGETTPSAASSEHQGHILVLLFVTQSCG
jgi:hypothetical protein